MESEVNEIGELRMPRATVVLDESKSPYLMVGATIFETSLDRVEDAIDDLYGTKLDAFNLDGSRAFSKFEKDGFHATNDTHELSVPFLDLLRATPGFSGMIYFSAGPVRPDIGPVASIAILYSELLTTAFRRLKSQPGVDVVFEQNGELDRHFESIARLSAARAGYRGIVRISLGAKRRPHVLAVTDYLLHTFGAWHGNGASTSPQDFRYRNWCSLRGRISLVRSIQEGTLYRRGHPVADLKRREEGRRSVTPPGNARDSRTEDEALLPLSSIPSVPSGYVTATTLLRPIGYSLDDLDALGSSVRDGTAYETRRVAKRRGRGHRTVFVPTVELRSFLKLLSPQLQSQLAYESHPAAFGYVPGRSTLAHAAQHLGQPAILSVDIERFFESIDRDRLLSALTANGCDPSLATRLVEVLLVNGSLAAGFPTSPYLSNVVFESTDDDLAALARQRGIAYSRFADDLTFSGEPDDDLLGALIDKLSANGWSLNEKKTRFMRRGGPQYVTGLYVGDDRPHLPRRVKRAMRSEAYYISKYGYASHVERNPNKAHGPGALTGWVRYANQIDPSIAASLWKQLSNDFGNFGRRGMRLAPHPELNWDGFLGALDIDSGK